MLNEIKAGLFHIGILGVTMAGLAGIGYGTVAVVCDLAKYMMKGC